MPEWTRNLISIHTGRASNSIFAVNWSEGVIGQTKWRSKPTGIGLTDNNNLDVDFLNAYIAQQLPNASVHIKWITKNGENGTVNSDQSRP